MADRPLEFHPLADLFPMLEGDELQDLVDDIEEHGQREPITLYEGQILDGRNRYRACEMLGLEPQVKVYDGDDPVAYALSLNLKRRHLKAGQRAMVAEKVATMRQGERTDLSSKERRLSQQEAADLLHVTLPSVKRARVVRKHGSLELVRDVEAGEMTVWSAEQKVRMEQRQKPKLSPHPLPVDDYVHKVCIKMRSVTRDLDRLGKLRDEFGQLYVDALEKAEFGMAAGELATALTRQQQLVEDDDDQAIEPAIEITLVEPEGDDS